VNPGEKQCDQDQGRQQCADDQHATTDIGDALTPLDLEARAFDAALRNAFTLSKRWLAMSPVEMESLVLDIVERVTIAANRIDIWLNREKIAAAPEAGGGSQRPDVDPITLSIEAKVRRAGKGKRLVIENGAEAEVNAGLVEMIKDAFTIRTQLLSGSDDSIEE
jgi:site-specific DNA recombinase